MSLKQYLRFCQIIIIITNMQIHQNYQIKQLIGHGASCTVRKAIRKDTRQTFAIKVYENQILKAKNQIDILIRLDHPSIVNIYQIFEEENTIILVLEYMAGGELYAQVGQRQKFTQNQVREYMKIIIDAVRYCHQMNIVHRDIKVNLKNNFQPQNLLLTTNGPDGILKLADFGISKILSEEMLTTNCGTPVYMAPQIWKGQAYNEKADIWSVGVVMYYLLSGNHPYDGDDDELGNTIISAQLKFPQDQWNSISSKAINLIKQLLNKNPLERPSAKDIQSHIWLTHIQPIPKQIQEAQEVNLYRTIHKIKRFIYKDKMKKTTKKLKNMMTASSLSQARLNFLAYQSLESQSQPTQIQPQSQMNEFAQQQHA